MSTSVPPCRTMPPVARRLLRSFRKLVTPLSLLLCVWVAASAAGAGDPAGKTEPAAKPPGNGARQADTSADVAHHELDLATMRQIYLTATTATVPADVVERLGDWALRHPEDAETLFYAGICYKHNERRAAAEL